MACVQPVVGVVARGTFAQGEGALCAEQPFLTAPSVGAGQHGPLVHVVDAARAAPVHAQRLTSGVQRIAVQEPIRLAQCAQDSSLHSTGCPLQGVGKPFDRVPGGSVFRLRDG